MSSIIDSDFEDLTLLEEDAETVYEGRVKTIRHDKCFGFVQVTGARLPDRFTRADVYFKWFEEKANEFQSVQQGMQVHFKLDEKSQDEKPSLKELCVIDGDFARNLPVAIFGRRRNRSSHMRSATPSGQNKSSRSRSRSSARRSSRSLVAMEIDIDDQQDNTSDPNEGGATGAPTSSNGTNQKRQPKIHRAKNRLTGVVVTVIEKEDNGSLGFIEPDIELPPGYPRESDVRFYVRDVKPVGIVPKRGDEVSFVLGSRDKTKAHAIRVYVESYGDTRSESEIEGILRSMYEKVKVLTESQKSDGLIELLSGLEVWTCVTDYRALGERGIEILIRLLFSLKAISQGLQGNFKAVLRAIAETHFFNPTKGSLVQYVQSLVLINDQDGLGNVRRFLLMVIEFVPEKINLVSSIIKPMVSTDKLSVESFIYHVLKKAVSQGESDSQFEDKEWKDLSLVPTSQEILHGPLEGAFNLRPVNANSPYASVEEYLDTYFRLFRADCFSALNKGVRDLLKGKLDHRDMNAYHSIELFGIDLSSQDMPITIAIQLTPFRLVRKWDKSRNLMFGNLVCISVTGNFRDAIWATVVSRDLLQQKSVVMLELCSECNALEDSEAIQYLEHTDKRSVLVESPTYYRAYQPILKNLQRMDPEMIPFQNEIVLTQKVVPSPNFIQEDTTIKGSLLYKDLDRIPIQDFFLAKGLTTFDKSQELAFKHCLFRRIAIVQGPPGTGKTFIGVRLVRALNSLSTKPNTPILLLTYKNHALDEFLKQLAERYPEKIARIGGRQQDAEMARFNLSNLKKETKKSKDLFSKLMDHREEMNSLGNALGKGFESTCQGRSFNFQMFFANANPQQLEHLLLNCPWMQINVPSVLASSGFRSSDDFTTVTGKRRGHKGPLVDRKEITEILQIIKSLTDNIKEFYNSSQTDANVIKLQTGFQMLLFEAFKTWLPHPNVFALIKDTLNHSAAVDFSKFATKESDKKSDKDERDDDSDDEAKEEEEERKAATDTLKGVKTKLENIIRVEKKTGGAWMPERFPVPKEYLSNVYVSQLLNQEELWDLSDKERVLYVQIMMHMQFQESSTQFSEDLARFKAAYQCKKELENLHSLSILQQKKFVGMTITGASIHCDLIAQLRPAIVVVEEAAEVMEPQLLSCLGPWVKQLILIGDHQQLRPNVESFELRRNYHLDISLMERLINNGLEFSTLQLQNRMRPEFAEMLKDIYPHLESNMKRVLENKVPASAGTSMYFWCHRFQECGPDSKGIGKSSAGGNIGRSFTNDEEADRCINLALFFIQQGHKATEITILGAYLGQVKLLKKRMNQAQTKYPNLFPEKMDADKGEQIQRDGVTIQTIDNYQGDENIIVIVSLVRSNSRDNIGFLNTLNRRCVAQSRAKCGMYFVGNEITIGSSKHWSKILTSMKELDAVGPGIPLQCKNHSTTRVSPANAEDIPLKPFCVVRCNVRHKCGIHKCQNKCQPFHDHKLCSEIVRFKFPKCGHIGTRKCWEDQTTKVCQEKVIFTYPDCHHAGERVCYEDERKMICTSVVTFQHPCSHYDTRDCAQDPNSLSCQKLVMFKFPCNHTGRKKCYENEKLKKCDADVYVMLRCGHHASKKCREDESTITCKEKVDFKFTKCGHFGRRLCYQSENDVRCGEKCLKPYPGCKHSCLDLCSQPCIEDRCKACNMIKKAKEAKAREEEKKKIEAIKMQIDSEIAAIKASPGIVTMETLHRDGDGAAEFYDVKDKVMRYIQPMHNWYPNITKIEKIVNKHLLIKFLQCKKTLFDPSLSQYKFHGTNTEATKLIIQHGFKVPKPNKQMYGAGIYFATDSSKSAREIYTKGSNMLLLCEVLLGKSYTAKTARPDMDAAKLASIRCDSLMAPRGSDVKNDEFVVYNPDQALPKYLIHYRIGDVSIRTLAPTPTATKMEKHTIVPKRIFKLDDPLEMHLRIVESQFARLASKYKRPVPDIKSIDYYINPPLITKFEAKKAIFEQLYGKGKQESEAVLAFHGTASKNITSIVTNNFDRAKISRTVHGYGIYFSEFPEVSTGYGNALLLCRVLPGNSHTEVTPVAKIPTGCDSIAVKPDSDGRAQMLVIENPDQILPCYVVNT